MTTIAFKDGILCSDSRVSAGGTVVASMAKVERTAHNILIGWAGEADCRELEVVLRKAKTPSDLPSKKFLRDLEIDCHLIIAFSPTCVYRLGSNDEGAAFVHEVNIGATAIGSGGELALGAMAAGASAAQAVEIACGYDCYSGLPVHSIGFAKAPMPSRRTTVKKPKPK